MTIKTNYYLDLALLVGFLISFEPRLTGAAWHEWLSLAFGGALVIHLLLHWDWIIQVGRRFFRKLWHSSRLNFFLNSLLLLAFVTVMLSGVMISRTLVSALGITLPEQPAWRFLHSRSADLTLILLGLHIALHWKWILSTTKRYLFGGKSYPRRKAPSMPAAALQPARLPVPEETQAVPRTRD